MRFLLDFLRKKIFEIEKLEAKVKVQQILVEKTQSLVEKVDKN